MKEICKPPELARASLVSLMNTKQFPNETVTQFQCRLEPLAVKAYHHYRTKEREHRTISFFASGLLGFRLSHDILTIAPQTLSEAERFALEYLQIRRGIRAARPLFRRKEPIPSLLGDSKPTGETPMADSTKSQNRPTVIATA